MSMDSGSSARTRRRRLGVVGVVACATLLASHAMAEIYKWKDAEGRLHFAQDLNQVPSRYRAQAKGDAIEEGSGGVVQRYEAAPAAPRATRRNANPTSAGQVHEIRVQKTGNSMRVNVRLNDRVTAPFIIDTGATDVSLPAWVAKELGLDLEGARTGYYRTANGVVESALLTLESVQLGSARAENVPAHVSKSMSIGLLGLAFFNHFQYNIDPVAGLVTLRPNGLVEAGKIRAGRSESQWRAEFARLAARRDAVERAIDEAGSNRSRRKEELREYLEEVDRQYRMLESDADDARVPMQWRD